MEDENKKQAEARRVLDAIRQKQEKADLAKEPAPQKPSNWLVSEDAAQLQALVEQSRGIKGQTEDKEDLPGPENIDPISVEQVKVMRKFVAGTTVHKPPPLSQTIYEALIRAYFETADFLKPSGRAKRCLVDGHQCLHCGKKFPAAPFEALSPAESTQQQNTTSTNP
jgi:hypothetical protein